MLLVGKCAWCGNSYEVGNSTGFCSRKCEKEYFQAKNNQANNNQGKNTSNSTNKNELVEGAFTVIGAGLSLLVGSDKSKSDEKTARKKVSNADRLAEMTALRVSLEKKNEEWERNNPELAEKIKEEERIRKEENEKMKSWSLEEWYKAIDEEAHHYKNDTKIISKLERLKDKQKKIVSLNIEIKNKEKEKKYSEKRVNANIKLWEPLKTNTKTKKMIYNKEYETERIF